MVQYSPTRFDASFAALSDATRRGVLEQLGGADASITELAEKKFDTLAVRRGVASPGESTVRGVAALERCGIRPMLQEAMRDVLHRLSQSYHG